METPNKTSAHDLISALSGARAISAIIKAAVSFDVESATATEQKQVALMIAEYATSKNGPSLMMSLPGPMLAMLKFLGVALPGVDRLAHLRATPRQIISRLVESGDDSMVLDYPVEKIRKNDWAYYIENKDDGDLASPCVKFVSSKRNRPEGFSDKEIGELVLKNPRVLRSIPSNCIPVDCAFDVLTSGRWPELWRTYDLSQFEKNHWRGLLKHCNLSVLPKECEKFLENADGQGFSHDELLELSESCPAVIEWLNPLEVPFDVAYRLYKTGNANSLWKRYPFQDLKKDEWKVILKDVSVKIPIAFSAVLGRGMFSPEELLPFASTNARVIPYLDFEAISAHDVVSLLIKTDSEYLWNNYPFKNLDAELWLALLKGFKDRFVRNNIQLLRDAEGLNPEIVSKILDVNVLYWECLPLALIPPGKAVKILLSGRADPLWLVYPFSQFRKCDWQEILKKSSRIPDAFKSVVEAGVFSNDELCDYACGNVALIPHLPLVEIGGGRIVDLLIRTRSEYIFCHYDFGKFKPEDWVNLLRGYNGVVPCKYLGKLKTVEGLSIAQVREILAVSDRYSPYVPIKLIPHSLVIEYLLAGRYEAWWDSYPFELFTTKDWFELLEKTTHEVPDAGKIFLRDDDRKLSDDSLNALIAKRPEYAQYVSAERIDPRVAVKLLVDDPKNSPLWTWFDFSRFDGSQRKNLLIRINGRQEWPKELKAALTTGKYALKDEELLEIVDANPSNLVELITIARIQEIRVDVFRKICEVLSKRNSAVNAIARKFSEKDRPWLALNEDCLEMLLEAIPVLRKYVNWQAWDFKRLDRLMAGDVVYRKELQQPYKMFFLIWKHWRVILPCVLVVLAISAYAILETQRRVRLRQEIERQDRLIEKIREIDECGSRRELSDFLSRIPSCDRGVIDSKRIASIVAGVRKWESRRNEDVRLLQQLVGYSTRNWPQDCFETAAATIAKLSRSDTLNQEDKRRVNELTDALVSAREFARRRKVNDGLLVRLNELAVKIPSVRTVQGLMDVGKQVESLTSDQDALPETVAVGKGLMAKVAKGCEAHYLNSVSVVEDKVRRSESRNDLMSLDCELTQLQGNKLASESVVGKCADVRLMVKAKLDAIEQEEVRRGVAELLGKMEAVSKVLDGVASDEDATAVQRSFVGLKNEAYYEQFMEKHGESYRAVQSRIDGVCNSVKELNLLVKRMVEFANEREGALLISPVERRDCEELIRSYAESKGKHEERVKWKVAAVAAAVAPLTALHDKTMQALSIRDAINASSNYVALVETKKRLLEEFGGCAEFDRVDRDINVSQVDLVKLITAQWVSASPIYMFAGVVKVLPEHEADIVPLLCVDQKSDLYCLARVYDGTAKEWRVAMKKALKWKDGKFWKVGEFDYDKLQGSALFVFSPDWKEIGLRMGEQTGKWQPGMKHPRHAHWVASKEEGSWMPEIGYSKEHFWSDEFSKVHWSSHDVICDDLLRTGEREGEWELSVKCSACSGDGKVYHKIYTHSCRVCKGSGKLQRKIRCEKCSLCNWRGYQWEKFTCDVCKGQGEYYRNERKKCSRCDGDGRLWVPLKDKARIANILQQVYNGD